VLIILLTFNLIFSTVITIILLRNILIIKNMRKNEVGTNFDTLCFVFLARFISYTYISQAMLQNK